MTGAGTEQTKRRFFLRYLRQYCFIFAVMMVLSVSVHPALAQEGLKQQMDTIEMYSAQVKAMQQSCPACAAALANGTVAGGPGIVGSTLKIRQLDLDGTAASATIGGAQVHRTGNVTLAIRDADWDERHPKLPAGTLGTEGQPANSSCYNGTAADRLADFDSDPQVISFISAINASGFSTRSMAVVERYGHEFNQTDNQSLSAMAGKNLSATPIIEDVARYVYTNATGYRYKFYATQVYAADMSPFRSKEVLPGGIYPPLPKIHDDSECAWAIALVVLAILAVLAAMLIAIGITIVALFTAGSGGFTSYSTKEREWDSEVPKPPFDSKNFYDAFKADLTENNNNIYLNYDQQQFDLDMKNVAWDPDHIPDYVGRYLSADDRASYIDYIKLANAEKQRYENLPPEYQHHIQSYLVINWALTIVFIIAGILAGILVGGCLISLALLGLSAAVMTLTLCKGWVSDQNDREALELRLNPEGWNRITEKDNGGVTYVPVGRPNEILVKLSERNESGVDYTWNITSMHLNSTALYNIDEQAWDRIWRFTVSSDRSHTFSARYVRQDDPAGPALKEFAFTIAPVIWDPAGTAVGNGKDDEIRYGTSLAIDPATNRMHVAYTSYINHKWGPHRGMLMYTSGTGTTWDTPVVVDDAIETQTEMNILEMGRTTSIALDADGNPHIAYRDNVNGHLKYAHLLTEKSLGDPAAPPTMLAKNGWVIETVDESSAHTGWGPSIAIGRDGKPRIAYLYQGGWEWDLVLKYAWKSGDYWEQKALYHVFPNKVSGFRPWEGGGIWTGLGGSNIGPGEGPSLALDSADRPHISFADYARYPDAVAHPENTDRPQDHANNTLPHYNWRSGRNNYDLVHLFMASNGSWVSEFVDPDIYAGPYVHFSRHGLYSSIAIDRQDQPHISYFSAWDEVCEWQADTEYYKWTDNIAWFNRPAVCHYKLGGLKYAGWNGTAWNRHYVDATSISVGEYSSLKIDAEGRPHLAYMDVHNNLVRYATKDKAGTSWSRILPDKKNSYNGGFSSIGLDARGNPRIVAIGDSGRVSAVFGKFDTPASSGHHTIPTATPVTNSTPLPTDPALPADPAIPDEPVELQPIHPPEQDGSFGNEVTNPLEVTSPPDPRGIAAATAKNAGATVAYSFASSGSSDNLAVHTVSFIPDRAIPASMAWARTENPGSYLQINEGPAVYANIGISQEKPAPFREARIAFSVPEAWLAENNIRPDEVVMMHQQGVAWTSLPTTLELHKDGRYYYSATTPGFSYFAVTDKATARAITAQEVTGNRVDAKDTNAGTSTAVPTPVPEITKPSVVLPRAKAPAPAPAATLQARALAEPGPAAAPDTSSSNENTLFFWIGVAGLVSMVGVAGFFIGRRLWWQYQNPALFRKYD